MSDGLTDAARAFALKRNVPTELLSDDFDLVTGWLKERSFWMAGVTDAETLQAFRREIEMMTLGHSGGAESMGRLGAYLEDIGYKPPTGTEGTIKDLSTWRRMSVALDTNVAMVRGYGMRYRAQTSLRAFPAWEFYRLGQRKVPRDWEARWNAALAQTAGIPGAGHFFALINHPIWTALSRFGTPYPIFDYGSGMSVKLTPRSKAKALGLLDDPRTRAMWENPQLESPNATLQAKPDITERALRDALSERLRGLARWDGDTLIHTDPNGTRPMPAKDLADVWRAGLPDDFKPRQMNAFLEWVRDSGQFNDANPDGNRALQPGSDQWDDFLRFVDRLTNAEPATELWRGMRMTPQAVEKFASSIETDGYAVRPTTPAESWTSNERAAATYARLGEGSKWSVMLRVNAPQSAKDITALVREFSAEIGKETVPTVAVDAEWLYRTGTKFRVLRIERDAESRVLRVALQEAP